MRPLPAEAVHISFEPAPYRMAMGLTACPWSEWLELDDRYVPEMAERRELLAKQRNEVLVSVPGSEVACRETLDRLGAHLPEQYPDWFVRNGRLLENRLTGEIWDVVQPPCGPLALAARLVQEDLCIIQLEGGVPVLTAGVVCLTRSPVRWLTCTGRYRSIRSGLRDLSIGLWPWYAPGMWRHGSIGRCWTIRHCFNAAVNSVPTTVVQ
jgi:dimethylamine monooxygenase subunit A